MTGSVLGDGDPTDRELSRRRLLALAGPTVLAGPALLAGLGGCTLGTGAPSGPDPLEPLVDRARADAALAEAVAAAHPELAGRLTPVAEARRAHAQALAQEVVRARPDRTSAVALTTPPATGAPPPDAARSPINGRAPAATDSRTALTAVVDALDAGRAQAADATRVVPRYRAGLVGSVAACCAGEVAMLQ